MMASSTHTILVVEDSDEDFSMIEHGLRQTDMPHRTQRFTRLSELESWLEQNETLSSLAFLDLNLPGEKGHNAISLLRRHPRHKYTPLLILTTSMSAQDVEACYASGANAYHVKPLETPIFHDKIAEIANYWFHKTVLPQRVL